MLDSGGKVGQGLSGTRPSPGRGAPAEENPGPGGIWYMNPWGHRKALTHWTMERFFRSLLLVLTLGITGVLISRISFCPEGMTSSFWEGCSGETLGLGLGGAALGSMISLMVTRGLKH